jgi:ATP-binding protein involved in chromosome partitioning
VLENMSYLVGSGAQLFGAGGGEELAREIGAPLLGQIPLDPGLRECADRGEPFVSVHPESETAAAIVAAAEAIDGSERERGVGIVKALPVLS